MSNIFLIKKPLITDKATRMGNEGKYAFVVESSATKPEIKKAVKALYKVDVTGVNITRKPDKTKRYRNVARREAGYKKAVVTLKTGQKIDTQ